MKDELISVIIPVYNTEKYLERCIKSIVNQTYRNIEIILVNDGSTDSSLEICKSFLKDDKRIKLFSQSNKGVSAARNLGMYKATGKAILFVDSDDYLELQMIEILYRNMINYKVDISICNYKIVNGVNIVSNNDKNLCGKLEKDSAFKLLFDDSSYKGYLWNKLINKRLLDNEISFDENISFSEDLLFLCKIFEKINNVYYDNTLYLYNYYKREDSAVNKAFNKKNATFVNAYLQIIPYIEIYNKDKLEMNLYELVFCAMKSKNLKLLNFNEMNEIRNKYIVKIIKCKRISFLKKIKLIIISYFKIIYKFIEKYN